MSTNGAVPIGRSPLRVPPLGVGTWSWGDVPYWGYREDHGPSDVVDAFIASVEAGLRFFDTAEVYGHGESEKILGFLKDKLKTERGVELVVATKFALLRARPGGARGLGKALENSLKRLRSVRVDLHQIHWPDAEIASIEELMAVMADAVHAGKVVAVGVSNFSAFEMRKAHEALAKRGIPLASNQVHYSLLHRAPEADGVLEACRELGVTLLAYSPLEQGLLTGKYDAGHAPRGPRATQPMFVGKNMQEIMPVIALLRRIGEQHGGRPPEQVALRWLAQRGDVIPIAGAKTGAQAQSNARALSFELGDDEVDEIDRATSRFVRS